MPRVFYKEKKISGNPVETAVITINNLGKLFANSNELEKLRKLAWPNFKYFCFIHGGSSYNDTEKGIFFRSKTDEFLGWIGI
jgi:hypothetical protein